MLTIHFGNGVGWALDANAVALSATQCLFSLLLYAVMREFQKPS